MSAAATVDAYFLAHGTCAVFGAGRFVQVIYVARNPKDVIVSYYFLYKLYKVVHDYQGDLELFAEYFMNDEGMRP